MTMPTNPWGTDLWVGPNADGVLDIDPSGRVVSGLPVLVQSVVMAQTTPTGSLIGSPDECDDLRLGLSSGMTVDQIQAIKSRVTAVLLRDQRITQVKVSVAYSFATATLTITETIQSSAGPFTLTLTISQAAGLAVGVLYQ
jgi:hypothetical protein